MQDPVCGMEISPACVTASSVYAGRTYVFCARTCKELFDKAPERYLHPTQLLSQHARHLYSALGTLNKVFYGPATQTALGRDLTVVEKETLHLLGARPACRMRELATACGVALSTMTGVIDRLVQKDLVQRQHSNADRRVVVVQLTDQGQLAYQELIDADMRLVLTMLQALSPQEQQDLVTLMQKVVDSLLAHTADAPVLPQPADRSKAAEDHLTSC